MAGAENVQVRLPSEVVNEIDAEVQANPRYMSRSEFIRVAIYDKLDDIQKNKSGDLARVELTPRP